jgi:8-oxo-dGTP pyrophosphatase MutT (NUDIX family)
MTDAPIAEIRPAATVLLLRDDPGFEVLMVKRHHQIEFASGALVFPGGKTHPGDYDPAWSEHAEGWAAFDPEQRALRIAAIREVFEEAGVLLARGPGGAELAGEACSPAVRAAVDMGETPFLDVVAGLGVRLDLNALSVFARWITPTHVSRRFDTWFFAAKAPADQLAACDGRETVDAEWIGPAEALRLAVDGKRKVVFPTRMQLQLLGEAVGADDAISRATSRRLVAVTPSLQERAHGAVLVLPPDAGYGVVEEPLENTLL